jgi:hypothetical protein
MRRVCSGGKTNRCGSPENNGLDSELMYEHSDEVEFSAFDTAFGSFAHLDREADGMIPFL